MAMSGVGSWSDGLESQSMPRYHVRTRDSLVGEVASMLSSGRDEPMEERELLEAALKKMDQEGWKLVAAAGEALLFRALRSSL